MTTKRELTAAILRAVARYDEQSGKFYRREFCPGYSAGSEMGCPEKKGYIRIQIEGRKYAAHRLAWLYVHGEWPSDQIDHRNGVKSDNRISNLRQATNAQNGQNLKLKTSNHSGYMGVTWCWRRKCWAAQIMCNRKQHHLGYYPTREDAHKAYLEAKKSLHVFHPVPRHGR